MRSAPSFFARPVLLAALILVTHSGAAGAQQTVSVNGTVTDAVTARPLLGAVVTLSSSDGERTARTDELGNFFFPKVTPGRFPLAVVRLGYQPLRQTIEVRIDAPRVAVSLTRIGALDTVRIRETRQGIYGAVGTAHDLRPLNRAIIQILGESGERPAIDSTGHFFAPLGAPGPYVVRAQAPGYEPQTVSVTVPRDQSVEVALLLDSAMGPASRALTMAFAEFDDRLKVRRNASALLPRAELIKDGNGSLLGAIRNAPSFVAKSLAFGPKACVFVDGRPQPGVTLDMYEPIQVEAIETYTASSDRDGSLGVRWPKGFPCANTGLPSTSFPPLNTAVQWVVIWLKQ